MGITAAVLFAPADTEICYDLFENREIPIKIRKH